MVCRVSEWVCEDGTKKEEGPVFLDPHKVGGHVCVLLYMNSKDKRTERLLSDLLSLGGRGDPGPARPDNSIPCRYPR